jgi:TonB family protein
MFEFNTMGPKNDSTFLDPPRSRISHPVKQQRLMAAALGLLLFALAFVLYRDRNFWFPDTPQAENQSQNSTVATAKPPAKTRKASARHKAPQTRLVERPHSEVPEATGDTAVTRTALPPLEIEVLAGNVRRTVHPRSNSVEIDLAKGSMPRAVARPTPPDATDTAASVTSTAAERVVVSADVPNVVTRSVTPGYPMLARQMKVQGAVILQAMIGRDGLIQELHVVSGPPILAGAAQEAVKQWHFSPHFQGSEAIETQAKITVNFTISTN